MAARNRPTAPVAPQLGPGRGQKWGSDDADAAAVGYDIS